ncbi:MAG: hypothetical protein C0467_11890 [Planctomycetaceae bacterium]|nr:hypothetical protein [Planctomycetaceae bacterium]
MRAIVQGSVFFATGRCAKAIHCNALSVPITLHGSRNARSTSAVNTVSDQDALRVHVESLQFQGFRASSP